MPLSLANNGRVSLIDFMPVLLVRLSTDKEDHEPQCGAKPLKSKTALRLAKHYLPGKLLNDTLFLQ